MDKNKILEKSRKEMPKEEYEQVKSKGINIGYYIFSALFIFLIIFDFVNGKDIYEIMTLFWGLFAGLAYSKYKTYKHKSTLIGFVCSIIACLGFLANYVIHVLEL